MPGQHPAPQEQVSRCHEEQSSSLYLLLYRYGSGFTLKAKVDLSHKKVATVGTGATAATEQQQQSLGYICDIRHKQMNDI